jgi:hypothetical protein
MRKVSKFFGMLTVFGVLALTLLGCGIARTEQLSAPSDEAKALRSALPGAGACQPVAAAPACYNKDGVYVLESWTDNPRHCDYKGPLPKNYELVAYELCKDLPDYDPRPFAG